MYDQSVYQKDYTLPSSRGFGIVDALIRELMGIKPPKPPMKPPPPPPERSRNSVDFFAKDSEWTPVAPLGRLLQPAIIPNTLEDWQKEIIATEDRAPDECMEAPEEEPEHPNAHVRLFRTVFPELYERLKVPPRNPRLRRPLQNVDLSTYQYEFCYLNAFPDDGDPLPKRLKPIAWRKGEAPACDESVIQARYDAEVAEQLKIREKLVKVIPDKDKDEEEEEEEFEEEEPEPVIRDKVAEVVPCEVTTYEPFLEFPDSTRFASTGSGVPWPKRIFHTSPDYTEYQDTIHRTGCMIVRNNLHIHTECENDPRLCKHPLIHKCKRLK